MAQELNKANPGALKEANFELHEHKKRLEKIFESS